MGDFRTPRNFSGAYDATSLLTHLAASSLTVCVCVKVTPVVVSVVAFTSHTQDITGLTGHVGVTFKTTTGVSASEVEHSSGVQAANMEIDTLLISAGLTEADVLAGKWTGAEAELFLLNYEAPTMGELVMQAGKLSDFHQMGAMMRAEIRGWNQATLAQIGRLTAPECDADLGDARCGVSMGAFTHTGTLTAVTSQLVFRDSSRTQTGDYFQNGKITFTSGNNNGLTFEIKSWDATNKEFALQFPTPYLPVIGDTYSAKRGCQKRLAEDCVAVFSNGINHRGVPYTPLLEKVHRVPQE